MPPMKQKPPVTNTYKFKTDSSQDRFLEHSKQMSSRNDPESHMHIQVCAFLNQFSQFVLQKKKKKDFERFIKKNLYI